MPLVPKKEDQSASVTHAHSTPSHPTWTSFVQRSTLSRPTCMPRLHTQIHTHQVYIPIHTYVNCNKETGLFSTPQTTLLNSHGYRIILLMLCRYFLSSAISSANKQILDGSEGRTCTLPTSKQKRIVLNRRISFVPSDVLIDYTRLEFGKTLGQGAFGRVLRAVLHNTEQEDNIVAVKTVQDTSDSKLVMKFLEEGLIMKRFDHVNVMGLLGLTFDPDDNPMLVLPFMANGDLKTFMIRKKKPLPTSLLLRFASHVALGMAYLAQHKFVHRDLAARNCMVNGDLLVKIADFGLSRDLKELDYYTSDDAQAKLPIKWMAPECMERKVYNARTDVWSYGVVLWEIFSQGVSPYPGLANRDVYDFLKTGQRMYAPVNCPPTIYGIMQRCWLDNPKSRCTFTQIVSEVEGLLAGNLDNLPESKVGSVRKGRAERRGRPDPRRESYLVPMQMETAFGADGPYSDDENNVTGRGGGRDYMNKSVFR